MARSPSRNVRNPVKKMSLPPIMMKSTENPLSAVVATGSTDGEAAQMIVKRKQILSANTGNVDRILKMNAQAKLQRRMIENKRINEENKALVRRIYDRKSNL